MMVSSRGGCLFLWLFLIIASILNCESFHVLNSRNLLSTSGLKKQKIPLRERHLATLSEENEAARRYSNHTFCEYDSWNMKKEYVIDPTKQLFQSSSRSTQLEFSPDQAPSYFKNLFLSCFIPSGELTSDYYKYSSWRIFQRFIGATNSVFGTQALLLALGFKKSSIGIAAATTWILKDALGKFARIFWASMYGRKFDTDAKKWKFRSSLFFTIGNTLEILTYIYPSIFLFAAAIANALKQMAMLTAASTRNTIYKSFARNLDNIGDITAKGESQVAVIDLLGMFAGIWLGKSLHSSKIAMIWAFVILSILDIVSVYFEIRSVVFDSMNFERLTLSLPTIFKIVDEEKQKNTGIPEINVIKAKYYDELRSIHPSRIAKVESMLYSSTPNEKNFVSWSQINHMMMTVGRDEKTRNSRLLISLDDILSAIDGKSYSSVPPISMDDHAHRNYIVFFAIHENPSRWEYLFERIKKFLGLTSIPCVVDSSLMISPYILLHKKANHEDVFELMIIFNRFYQLLERNLDEIRRINELHRGNKITGDINNCEELKSLIRKMLEESKEYGKKNLEMIKELLESSGWDMKKFMFGSLPTRVKW